eukprot:gnl/TRDRNA2_/TRDRNA2_91928_c0_seq1.p1 gnl/TRDRNA2_/TRDRNA2_91928_c0~~gnl/TRDRNA2_/TRDRNA2_91928_c0_seq1.p1  ORF type:complete len:578 (-),score=98.17 gnl/TRDRNA2_/TRDRNA2_91928_c0_seq1:244-1977(-)
MKAPGWRPTLPPPKSGLVHGGVMQSEEQLSIGNSPSPGEPSSTAEDGLDRRNGEANEDWEFRVDDEGWEVGWADDGEPKHDSDEFTPADVVYKDGNIESNREEGHVYEKKMRPSARRSWKVRQTGAEKKTREEGEAAGACSSTVKPQVDQGSSSQGSDCRRTRGDDADVVAMNRTETPSRSAFSNPSSKPTAISKAQRVKRRSQLAKVVGSRIAQEVDTNTSSTQSPTSGSVSMSSVSDAERAVRAISEASPSPEVATNANCPDRGHPMAAGSRKGKSWYDGYIFGQRPLQSENEFAQQIEVKAIQAEGAGAVTSEPNLQEFFIGTDDEMDKPKSHAEVQDRSVAKHGHLAGDQRLPGHENEVDSDRSTSVSATDADHTVSDSSASSSAKAAHAAPTYRLLWSVASEVPSPDAFNFTAKLDAEDSFKFTANSDAETILTQQPVWCNHYQGGANALSAHQASWVGPSNQTVAECLHFGGPSACGAPHLMSLDASLAQNLRCDYVGTESNPDGIFTGEKPHHTCSRELPGQAILIANDRHYLSASDIAQCCSAHFLQAEMGSRMPWLLDRNTQIVTCKA